jgi:hypothetical protein
MKIANNEIDFMSHTHQKSFQTLAIGNMKQLIALIFVGVMLSCSCSQLRPAASDPRPELSCRIETTRPTDGRALMEQQELYNQFIPAALEAKLYREALDACDRYLEWFPGYGYNHPIRKWRTAAREGLKEKQDGQQSVPQL